ncbi:AAA family ATPase [Rickettsia endosymbiont of Ixodes pacificus]|uniref:AAA family ATPase n=1 Tax=Rickettsia endosymbiont of Ixodes pacificus TaxID=1133329 RepID=UPI000B0AD309|nr:AAA family ATPase [Rickettsia endosymbiont of Ixodes pacificus]
MFTKEDIAIALSDALMVHLVSKGSDIAKEQEAIREFGKRLVQECGSSENASQNIENNSVANTANDQADSRANNPAIEHLNKEYGEEFLRLYNQLLVSDKIELMDQKDLMGRTLYSLKSRVNLERRYISAIEELNAKEEHNLNINAESLERNSLKEQIGDLVNVVGANLQNKFNDKIGGSLGLKLNVFGSKNHVFSSEQIDAILSVCNGSDISILEGNPGAGETFVMREIVRQYKKEGFKVVGVYSDYQKRREQTRLADIAREAESKTLISHTEQIKHEIASEVFVALEKDQKFFVALNGNIKYRTFNYEFQDLAQQALEHKEQELLPKLKDIAAVEQHGVFSTQDILVQLKNSKNLEETYKHFDRSLESYQLETQYQMIQQDKAHAKTIDEMLTAISREHEFFKSLDGNLKYAEQYDSSLLSAISNAKTIEQDKLISNMHNMVVYAQKHGILKDYEILNQFNSSDSHNVLKNLSKTCEKHYMDHHNENIKQLLDDEHVMVGTKKYSCPLKYMKHEMQNNIPGFVDEKHVASTFAKVKAEVKELRLERELEHTMIMRL